MPKKTRVLLVTGVRPPMDANDVGNLGFHVTKRFIELGWLVIVHTRRREYAERLPFYFLKEQMKQIILQFDEGDLSNLSFVQMMAQAIKRTLGDIAQHEGVMCLGLSGVVLTPGDFPKDPTAFLSGAERQAIIQSNVTTVSVPVYQLSQVDCIGPDAVIITCSVVTAKAMIDKGMDDTGLRAYASAKLAVETLTDHLDNRMSNCGGRAFTLAIGVLANSKFFPPGFDRKYIVPMNEAARQVEVLVHFRVWPEGIRVVLDGGWTVKPGDGFWG